MCGRRRDTATDGKEYGMRISTLCTLAAIVSLCIVSPAPASGHTGTVLSPDSVSIGYTIEGKGVPVLVFVHGWCCDRSYWKHQVPHFAKKHTVVTIDLAGHGESGRERSDWTITSFAGDVASVVHALDLDQVVLIGHSMGGPVVLDAAGLLTDRVIGVIGVDTYQNLGKTFSKEQREQFVAPFEADFSGMTRRFVGSMFTAGTDSALITRVIADMSSAPPEVGIGAMKNMLAFDPGIPIKKIQAPIYTINSDMYPTNVEGNRKLVPTFTMKLMPGVGHFVMLEDPERFNALLDETISEMTATR
jgi:pimeloyl-ACP methyl ester carboxylesterase